MKNNRIVLLKYAKDNNLDFNIALKYYIFERFLYRISLSSWKDKLVLKGGFLLCILTGLKNRVTKDIDFSVSDVDFGFNYLKEMIEDIISIDAKDNISFCIDKLESIMEDSEYYGIRVYLKCSAFDIRDIVHIDFATGDIIDPLPSFIIRKTLLDCKEYSIKAYNLESILSEKLETILSKLENNSRMKDYFDIYLITHFFDKNIRKNNLKKSIRATFMHRSFCNNPFEAISIIKQSDNLKSYWNAYAKKNSINITFDEVVKAVEGYLVYIKPSMKKANLKLSFV